MDQQEEGSRPVVLVLPTISGTTESVRVSKEFLEGCASLFHDFSEPIRLNGLLFEKHAKVIQLWDQDDQYDMLHAGSDDLMSALGCADYLGHQNWLRCVSQEVALRITGMTRKQMAEELNVDLEDDPVLIAVEKMVQDVE